MSAHAESVLNPSRYAFSHLRRCAPDVCMALIVIAVGVSGLNANCWLRNVVEPWINIHLLFGALLGGWLTIRVRMRVRQSPCMQPSEIREMSRQLSRVAYLVLFTVIGIRLCVSIVASVWSGRYSLLHELFIKGPGGSGSSIFDPKDDYQMCLVSGLVALAFVRVVILRLPAARQ